MKVREGETKRFILMNLFSHLFFEKYNVSNNIEASVLLSTCSSDGPFSEEEKWIISHFRFFFSETKKRSCLLIFFFSF